MNLLILPLPVASLNNTEVSMHVQELQTVVAKENEQLKKGGSTREVADVAFLDHDHSASSTADECSAEVSYL